MKQSERLSRRSFSRLLRKRQTPEEDVLWRMLRARRFRRWKFYRQVPIGIFIVDFLCWRRRLIIEVDGPIHDRRRAYDAWREEILKLHGYRIVRFTNARVRRDLMGVLEEIAVMLNV